MKNPNKMKDIISNKMHNIENQTIGYWANLEVAVQEKDISNLIFYTTKLKEANAKYVTLELLWQDVLKKGTNE